MVGQKVVFQVPQVDAEVVCTQKVFPIWRHTERVDVETVTIFKLVLFDAFVLVVDDLTFGEHNRVALNLGGRVVRILSLL